MTLNKRKLIFFIFLALFFVAVFTVPVLAQVNDNVMWGGQGEEVEAEIGLSSSDPRIIVAKIIRVVLGFLGILSIGLIMYAGFMISTSGGNEEKVQRGKQILGGAVIGLVIVLSSFAIASFILGRLSDISGGDSPYGGSCDPPCAGGEICCSGTCQDGPCTVFGGSPYSFRIINTTPDDGDRDVIRNVAVKVFLNSAVNETADSSVLADNFTVQKIAEINPGTDTETDVLPENIIGEIELSSNRRTMTFLSSDNCDNELATPNCFDSWSRFRVTINGNSGIVDSDSNSLANSFNQLEFSTGDGVDTGSPTSGIIPSQVCFDDGSLDVDANTIGGWGRDSEGVSEIEFYYYDPLTSVYSESGFGNTYHNAYYQYDTSSLSLGGTYTFGVIAYDLANATSGSEFTTELRPGHCCNGILDADEEDIDCGGTDCLSCSGGACNISEPNQCSDSDTSNCADSLCSTNFCDCKPEGCICEVRPVVNWMTPEGGFCDGDINTFCRDDSDCSSLSPSTCNAETTNAASGNFITIGGQYFGTERGSVFFSSDNWNTEVLASFADDPTVGNPVCSGDVWGEEQVIVVLPDGFNLGDNLEARLESSTGFDDTSGLDGRGPELDFVVNSIQRPGICSLSPEGGRMNDTVTYQGINLGNVENSYFGALDNSIMSGASSFTVNSGTSEVPNLAMGRTTSFVINDANVNSNFLRFNKEAEPYTGPYITSFGPIGGSAGQYVTILGEGFGNVSASSLGNNYKVYFDRDVSDNTDIDNLGIEADFNFPDICLDSVWRDNQIIVKVPEGLNPGEEYFIVINVTGWSLPIDSSGVAEVGDVSSQFLNDPDLPLTPSQCRIEPSIGANNSPVSIWGEYFGEQNSDSMVRFSTGGESVIDQSGGAVSFWGEDDESSGGVRPDRVDTVVPVSAVSGLVRIVKDDPAIEGAGSGFEVGFCTQAEDGDEACGLQICCPSGTIEEGRCMDELNDCYGNVQAASYEWDFSTDIDLITIDPSSSCSGYDLIQCSDTYLCPNSPGNCSVGRTSETSCDASDYPRYDNSFEYIDSINTFASTTMICSRNEEQSVNIGGSIVDFAGREAICDNYEDGMYWRYNPRGASCVGENWFMGTDGWCTLGVASPGNVAFAECSVCDDRMECVDDGIDNNLGYCAVNREVCPTGSSCVDGLCTDAEDVCECCCRIGNGNQDCCDGLTCAGECGSDLVVDTDSFGECTGCTVIVDGEVDQDLSDQACNCSDTSGKYCDVTAAGGLGVCNDCADLSASPDLCTDHLATCCVDAENGNVCRDGVGDTSLDTAEGTIGYCGYYECNAVGDACSDSRVASSSYDIYSDMDTCNDECQISLIGRYCYRNTSCSYDFCPDFYCLDENGDELECDESGCGTCDDGTCGVCCCDPSHNSDDPDDPLYDECNNLNAGGTLECRPNQSPCSGEDRGLCCGCTSDNDCGGGALMGCGDNSCCRVRPGVESTIPANDTENVCRNAMISVEFDTMMDIGSFNGNIIVVGDYENDFCPEGTSYLSLDSKKSNNTVFGLFRDMSKKVKSFFGGNVEAFPIYPGNNYCAISGTVEGRNDGAERGVMEFSPTNVLDGNRTYFVIVKGDENLDSGSGVMDFWHIGMNADNSPVVNTPINGINYTNSYIFSFRTMPETGSGEGVCLIDSVEVTPENYLFVNNENNPLDDNPYNNNFDNDLLDSDREYAALALSGDGQTLAPISGVYDWTWNWSLSSGNIADFILACTDADYNGGCNNQGETCGTGICDYGGAGNIGFSESFIRVDSGITDGQTLVSAEAVTSGVDVQTYNGATDLYVFICDNPWPPVDSVTGQWLPWRDDVDGVNCSLYPESCYNTNFQLHYCRDYGQAGTYDDLPTISNTSVMGNDPNSDPNSEPIKEIFFFRALAPSTSTMEVINLGGAVEGGTALLTWDEVVDIERYNIYWGEETGNYSGSAEIGPGTRVNNNNNVTCQDAASCTILGLSNGVRYYFNITSINSSTGAESAYFDKEGGISLLVEDGVAPTITASSTSYDGGVELEWESDDTAVNYRVYHGASAESYGMVDYEGTDTAINISGLVNGDTYYFAVGAIDAYGNENITDPIEVTPLAE